jgi:hypothetical protein
MTSLLWISLGWLACGRISLAAEGPWIELRCRPLPSNKLGPFAYLKDGGVLAIDRDATFVSRDGGKTWSGPRPLFPDGRKLQLRDERALLCTRSGTLIASFMNEHERHWTWDDRRRDAPGARLPTYVMRSLDDGKTWQDVQKLHDDWTGAVRDIIQTRDGRVIVSSMKMLHDPGRHSVLTYSSTDDGKSWQAGNLIDLGGSGHHGGATEATVAELKDGRVWLLIRTNWGEFWSGYSFDGGRFWRILQPSGIPASSAPGLLKRLHSGRLLLVWNRPFPEGKDKWPLSGGDGLWSEVPVSNHREELSIAFSEDEGKSWTKPVVIARQKGKSLAYPYVFEHQPGELWLTTMQGGVRLRLDERDFIGK